MRLVGESPGRQPQLIRGINVQVTWTWKRLLSRTDSRRDWCRDFPLDSVPKYILHEYCCRSLLSLSKFRNQPNVQSWYCNFTSTGRHIRMYPGHYWAQHITAGLYSAWVHASSMYISLSVYLNAVPKGNADIVSFARRILVAYWQKVFFSCLLIPLWGIALQRTQA